MLESRFVALAALTAALLFFGCSDDGGSGPTPDTRVDAAADGPAGDGPAGDGPAGDGPAGDGPAGDGPDVDQGPKPDSGPKPDGPEADAIPVDSFVSTGDIGVTYTGTFPATPAVGFTNTKLTVDGVQRDVTIYAPAGWQQGKPLIIACPSTDTNGEDGIWDVAANELADQEKLVVVSLVPRKMSKGDWDQHVPGESFFETYPNVTFATNNDLKFVAAAIAEAQRVYSTDPKRVFTTGYSNGAFFAQFAALQLRDRITGFACSGGGLVKCADTFDCTFNGAAATTATCSALAKLPGWCTNCTGPEKPGPVPTTGNKPAAYIGHSANDDVVSVFYACELSARLTALGYPVKLDMPLKGGHTPPPHFMVDAWKWLKTFKLP